MLKHRDWGFACFAGCTAILFVVLAVMQPTLQEGRFSVGDNSDWQKFSNGLYFTVPEHTTVSVVSDADLHWWQPKQFRVRYNGCITGLSVNTHTANLPKESRCSYRDALAVHDGNVLRSGRNRLHFDLRASQGKRHLTLELTTKTLHQVLFLYAFLSFGLLVYLYRRGKVRDVLLPALLVIGVLLRIQYAYHTPFDMRGHDVYSHLAYIHHVLQHWEVPARSQGWVFYHPPLYYVVSATLGFVNAKVANGLNFLFLLKFFSLICSVITLTLAYGIAQVALSRKGYEWCKYVFTGVLAAFPSLIFLSARINNDVLVQVGLFGTLLLLLLWWQQPRWRTWMGLSVVCSLAVLTKANALLLLPILLVALFFKKGIPRRRKAKMLAFLLLVFGVTTGPFFYQRVVQEGQSYVVGNAEGNNRRLRVENSVQHMIAFSPIRLVSEPFNQPWKNSPSKSNFFEYFFRSAFFGEFTLDGASSYPKTVSVLASIILAIHIFLLAYVVYGLIAFIRGNVHSVALPLFVTGVFILAGHLALRLTPPTSAPGQDFRHSLLFLVPLLYFLCVGVQTNSTVSKWIGRTLILAGIVANAVLICLITL